MSHVAVDHQIQRLRLEERHGQGLDDAARESGEARVRRRARPAERQRHLGLALDEIEGREMAADRLCHARRVDLAAERDPGLQHLEVLARQEPAGIGDVDGVARELHAVLRGSDRRGADALARRQHRIRQGALIDALAQRLSESLAQIAEIVRLAPVDVLPHAAREHHARDAFHGVERLGEPQRVNKGGSGTARESGDERIGHPRRHALDVGIAHCGAEAPIEAGVLRQLFAGGIEAGEPKTGDRP